MNAIDELDIRIVEGLVGDIVMGVVVVSTKIDDSEVSCGMCGEVPRFRALCPNL